MKKIIILIIFIFVLSLLGCSSRATMKKPSFATSFHKDIKTKENTAYYTLSFDTLGGDKIESILLEAGSKIPTGIIAHKEDFNHDYNFIGWSYNNSLINDEFIINENITLTASYEVIEYMVVSFNSDGGTKADPIRVLPGQKITEPKNPTKITSSAEYEFLGWYLNDSLFDFNQEINENITLIAKWKKVSGYTVEF